MIDLSQLSQVTRKLETSMRKLHKQQMLWPDMTFVLYMVDWFENFSSWDWVLAGIILFE